MDALTALLHEDATWSMPPYDMWLQTHDDVVKWCLGPRHRLQGLAADPDDGERPVRVRPVQAGSRERRPRAVVAPGRRDLRRSDQRDRLLPRHRPLLPALRSAAPPQTASSSEPGEDEQLEEVRAGSSQPTSRPRRAGRERHRASASTRPHVRVFDAGDVAGERPRARRRRSGRRRTSPARRHRRARSGRPARCPGLVTVPSLARADAARSNATSFATSDRPTRRETHRTPRVSTVQTARGQP